jgi:AcrR family transcriptional regulator
MKSPRIDIGSIRREQIVEAAVAIIAEQGIQKLSLSEIEERAGMSRGQLTYYFKTKEDILLAVFDRLVLLMHQRIGVPGGEPSAACVQSAWAWAQHLLQKVVAEPPVTPEFGALQYTFLAQMGHREDFRKRLANLYEEWRSNMAQGFAEELASNPDGPPASPRAVASLVQAILHGLAMQRAADPQAFEPAEMIRLVTDVLENYLWPRKGRPRNANKSSPPSAPANGHGSPARPRRNGPT